MKTFDKKEVAKEGLKVGLKAFILTFGIAFVIALIINISVIEHLQDYLQGTLSQNIGFRFGMVIRTTSILMNMAVFNTSGQIQLGLLAFIGLPLFSFYLADRMDNKKEGMDDVGFFIYGVASGVYTILLMTIALIGKGTFLGVNISFVSIRNLILTFVISFLIQVVIGMNYDANRIAGVVATRWMIRLSLGVSGLIGIVAIIAGATKVTTNPLLILMGILLLAPNLMVYVLFMMMGIGIDFNSGLDKLLAFGNMNLTYTGMPVGVRIFLMILFIGITLYAISRIEKEKFLGGLIVFATLFSLTCLGMAYCTRINLGLIKGLMEVDMGINLIKAFLYPFVGIFLLGGLWQAIQRVRNVIKS
ncbi:conserved membrane protein of unknown function [Petrocella atlantisensis]|uniref:Uncharacterized protein n=1 Tax=Petrocella atlantisensis TaxID=2173034 RepID=A0A3P7NYC8_9FIRM|nr:hypothetical protein [Petrocella atlantisensis]VDN47965.1 conserved membrane protein of unknown function [Petrocella atlantisensis]